MRDGNITPSIETPVDDSFSLPMRDGNTPRAGEKEYRA